MAYVDKEPKKWLDSLLYWRNERDIKAIVSVTIRATLSLFWRRLAYITASLDDDGKFIFIAHKPK